MTDKHALVAKLDQLAKLIEELKDAVTAPAKSVWQRFVGKIASTSSFLRALSSVTIVFAASTWTWGQVAPYIWEDAEREADIDRWAELHRLAEQSDGTQPQELAQAVFTELTKNFSEIRNVYFRHVTLSVESEDHRQLIDARFEYVQPVRLKTASLSIRSSTFEHSRLDAATPCLAIRNSVFRNSQIRFGGETEHRPGDGEAEDGRDCVLTAQFQLILIDSVITNSKLVVPIDGSESDGNMHIHATDFSDSVLDLPTETTLALDLVDLRGASFSSQWPALVRNSDVTLESANGSIQFSLVCTEQIEPPDTPDPIQEQLLAISQPIVCAVFDYYDRADACTHAELPFSEAASVIDSDFLSGIGFADEQAVPWVTSRLKERCDQTRSANVAHSRS